MPLLTNQSLDSSLPPLQMLLQVSKVLSKAEEIEKNYLVVLVDMDGTVSTDTHWQSHTPAGA